MLKSKRCVPRSGEPRRHSVSSSEHAGMDLDLRTRHWLFGGAPYNYGSLASTALALLLLFGHSSSSEHGSGSSGIALACRARLFRRARLLLFGGAPHDSGSLASTALTLLFGYGSSGDHGSGSSAMALACRARLFEHGSSGEHGSCSWVEHGSGSPGPPRSTAGFSQSPKSLHRLYLLIS